MQEEKYLDYEDRCTSCQEVIAENYRNEEGTEFFEVTEKGTFEKANCTSPLYVIFHVTCKNCHTLNLIQVYVQ